MLASPQPKTTATPKPEPLQVKGPGCDCAGPSNPGKQQCLACGGPVQRKARPGFSLDMAGANADPTTMPSASKLPSSLKQSHENRSGQNLDDVQVFRNSPLPEKMGAWAFTKGTEIHLGPGQEKHLPHESWHAVQQKQGRVNATGALFGIPVNDQTSLENEADQAATAPAMESAQPAIPSPAASPSEASGVMQGVFKDSEGDVLSDEDLEEAVEGYDLTAEQQADLELKQSWDRELWLTSWLQRNGLVNQRKRKRRPTRSESEDDSDSSEDESRKPAPRKRSKKAIAKRTVRAKAGAKARIFKDNLGFQRTKPQSISRRQYFPAPTLSLTGASSSSSSSSSTGGMVSFAPTLTKLQSEAFKPGFRGNIVRAKFELVYRQNRTIKRSALTLPGVPDEFESADLLSKPATARAFKGINEMQETIGMGAGKSAGNVVHSERNMILQLDDLKIDDKLVAEIIKTAKGKNITVIRAVLVIFSEPNEVCGNCDTALRALTGASKIKGMKDRLAAKGVSVEPSFGLMVITGAGQLNTVRKFTSAFSGKPGNIPSVMHTHPPPS